MSLDDPACLASGFCERCGESIDDANVIVEAFEITGQLLCDDCAAEEFGHDDSEGLHPCR